MQDLTRTNYAHVEIMKHDGGIVPGLANRNGHRNTGRTGRRYTAPRVDNGNNTWEEMGVHNDAILVGKEYYQSQTNKFLQHLEAFEDQGEDSNEIATLQLDVDEEESDDEE